MRVRLSNKGDHHHEQMIGGLARVLGRSADDVAAEFIEMGAVLVAALALEDMPEMVADLERMRAQGKFRDAEPLLLEFRKMWAAAVLADPVIGREAS